MATVPSVVKTWLYEQRSGAGGGAGARMEPCWVTDFVIRHNGAQPPIGDGASHPLSNYFGSLAAAKAVYPFAQALTDELAWCAIQMAIYKCSYIYLPIGGFLINRPLDCTNKEFGGLHFFGAGQQSVRPVLWHNIAVDPDDDTKITALDSGNKPFQPWHQWITLQITSGAGFRKGPLFITDVSPSGVATCAASAGAKGSTGGQGISNTGIGSRIIAKTGGVVMDLSGSGAFTLHDFMIDGVAGVTSDYSTIGILFGRTYEAPAAESSLMNITRVVVQLAELTKMGIGANQCLNGGQNLGSIAVLNSCSENMTILHCYFQADRAYIGANQIPLNICDDYPRLFGSDGVWHGQPLRFFLPVSPWSKLVGGDVATPVHLSNVTVSGRTITYTTTEDLHDPALFYAGGWYNNGGVTVRGVTGFNLVVNVTYRQMTLIDAHTFSVTLWDTDPAPSGSYTGGGTAFLNTSFSEGDVTVISTAFIGTKGPCLTLGGVSGFLGANIYTLSYQTEASDSRAAYQITGSCYSLHIYGFSEMVSRALYSRFIVYDLQFEVDLPHDPFPGTGRVWLDGEFPDPEGGVHVPGIIAGRIRVNPTTGGGDPHQLLETGPITGTLACRAVLAPVQSIGADNGLVNIQVESSENWNPELPGAQGVYDFATHWGRRELGGALTLTGPLYAKGTALNLNAGVVGVDTDVQISKVEIANPIVIHTFTNHGLLEGQKVSMFGVSGVSVTGTFITNQPCHVVDATTITVPGVAATGQYLGGGFVRASGKDALFALFDAGWAYWMLEKTRAGGFALLDGRVGRSLINADRDFIYVGATGVRYTDLVIGSDPTTVKSALKPFSDPLSVGQTLKIDSGAGFTPQTVTILSVDPDGTAHCSAALGTAGSTGGGAFNPFALELVGDFIILPQHAAASGTLTYMALNDSGTLLPRTKAQSQADLGITGGGMVDPTTSKGDMLARSASALGRLAVGADGQILTADAAQALGVKWAAAPAGSPQTPWGSDIDAASHDLNNVRVIRCNNQIFVLSATDAVNTTPTQIVLTHNGLLRWLIQKDGAESGGNVGSNLSFYCYDDAGAFLNTAMTMNRGTAEVTFGGSVRVSGPILNVNHALQVFGQVTLSGISTGVPAAGSGIVYKDSNGFLKIA